MSVGRSHGFCFDTGLASGWGGLGRREWTGGGEALDGLSARGGQRLGRAGGRAAAAGGRCASLGSRGAGRAGTVLHAWRSGGQTGLPALARQGLAGRGRQRSRGGGDGGQ